MFPWLCMAQNFNTKHHSQTSALLFYLVMELHVYLHVLINRKEQLQYSMCLLYVPSNTCICNIHVRLTTTVCYIAYVFTYCNVGLI